MTSKKVYFIMIGIVTTLALLSVGGAVAGNNFLQQQANILIDAKLESQSLDAQTVTLAQANRDVEKYAELEKEANQIVPQDKDQAKTVREIIQIAEANSIPIASVTFPSSTLGLPKAGATSTPTASKIPDGVTQVTPVVGIPNVFQMEINVQSESTKPIPYDNFIAFLSQLEQNRRTAQVSELTIQPNTKDVTKVSFSLKINVFIKP